MIIHDISQCCKDYTVFSDCSALVYIAMTRSQVISTDSYYSYPGGNGEGGREEEGAGCLGE